MDDDRRGANVLDGIHDSSVDVTTVASSAGTRKRSRSLIKLATLLVTVLFSYIALSDVKLGAMWHALRTSDYWWLLPGLIVFGLGNLARALRWRSLFRVGQRPPVSTTFNAMMIGYLYNNILPARAGEAARIVVLAQRSSSPPVEITGTVVLERLYDLMSILVIFFFAAPWLPSVSWLGTAAIVAGVLAISITVAVTVLVVFEDRPVRLLLRPLHRFAPMTEERLERIVAELTHGLSGLHDWRVAIEAFVWTITAWMLSIVCAYLVMTTFHLHLPFASAVLVMAAIGAGMVLPAAPAAVGVFEGATLIALKAYGLSHTKALPYALVLHMVNFVPFVLAGAFLVHYNSRHPQGHSS